MVVKNRFEILEDRQSNSTDERCATALESISDILDGIFGKLQNIDSKL
jgi:hypothetical protein